MNRAKAISGEKLLRTIMSDNKIELYAAYVSWLCFYICDFLPVYVNGSFIILFAPLY